MPKKFVPACVLLLYAFAALQFTRFYINSTTPYLNMQAYLHGHERLPFQLRVLPILFLKPLANAAWVHRLAHARGAFTADRGPAYLLSLLSLVVASLYVQKLYERLTRRGLFRALVFPVFLFAVMWTYVIHSEANFFYPYDLPSLAFFTAGLYYIYSRRFWPLLTVILIGTFNRETTLFLIGIFVLDAVSSEGNDAGFTRAGFAQAAHRIPWLRAAVLLTVWLAIRLALARHFAGNDASESVLRLRDNLHQLRPRLLPALLNICGYVLPMVLLFSGSLRPRRFRKYLWIVPAWLAAMFCAGVLVETRIYGELCGFSAIAAVLLLERHAERRLPGPLTHHAGIRRTRPARTSPRSRIAA